LKTLLLLRHGKSSWDTPLPDHDRPLRKRGRRAAEAVGAFLEREGLAPDWLWTSTATRALDTARLVASAAALDIEPEATERLYGADAGDILSIVATTPDSADTVLVVGHNPGLGELAGALAGRDVHLTTCGLAVLELDVEEWAEVPAWPGARLVALRRPEPPPP
jgi:phosphohistidine phosphatase